MLRAPRRSLATAEAVARNWPYSSDPPHQFGRRDDFDTEACCRSEMPGIKGRDTVVASIDRGRELHFIRHVEERRPPQVVELHGFDETGQIIEKADHGVSSQIS